MKKKSWLMRRAVMIRMAFLKTILNRFFKVP